MSFGIQLLQILLCGTASLKKKEGSYAKPSTNARLWRVNKVTFNAIAAIVTLVSLMILSHNFKLIFLPGSIYSFT